MKRDLAFANGSVFQSLFESSADAIWLYDSQSRLLTDCNQAAVELMGAENKQHKCREPFRHRLRPAPGKAMRRITSWQGGNRQQAGERDNSYGNSATLI